MCTAQCWRHITGANLRNRACTISSEVCNAKSGSLSLWQTNDFIGRQKIRRLSYVTRPILLPDFIGWYFGDKFSNRTCSNFAEKIGRFIGRFYRSSVIGFTRVRPIPRWRLIPDIIGHSWTDNDTGNDAHRVSCENRWRHSPRNDGPASAVTWITQSLAELWPTCCKNLFLRMRQNIGLKL